VLNYLRARIVTVHAGDSRLATGFIVSPEGLIVTTAHAITEFPSHERLLDNLRVSLPSDDVVPARSVKIDNTKDLALLETSTERILMPLNLSASTPILGDSVTAVLVDLEGQIRVQVGTVSGLVTLPSGGERIAVSLKIQPGESGTPVVDKEGRLIGLVQSRDMKGTTYLTPAAQILDFIGTKQI
jgi:serine protease Do